MGEAKRKRMLREREWTRLFDGVEVAISRPNARPETMRRFEVAEDIAKAAAEGRPKLCGNSKCPNEILALPEVYAAVATKSGFLCVPFCQACAGKTDNEIHAIVRLWAEHHGLTPSKYKSFTSEILIGWEGTITLAKRPVRIVTVWTEDDLAAGVRLARLMSILIPNLKQFSAVYFGVSNCHAIADTLRSDLNSLALGEVGECFKLRTGSSALMDDEGLHSWVEVEGWVIDATNGAHGNPITVERVDSYLARLQITNVRDFKKGTQS